MKFILQGFLLVIIIASISCRKSTKEAGLDRAFIESFKKGKFSLLEEYLPSKEFYKSLGKDVPSRTDTEIDTFLNRSKQRLIENWERIQSGINERKIDLSKVEFKESIVFNPYKKSIMQAMVIMYEYNGKTWDDVSIITKQQEGKFFLLEIPNPFKAFKMTDTMLVSSSQAKAALELETSAFQETVKRQVKQLMEWAKNRKLTEFAESVVYNGTDENRAWKSPLNVNDSLENKLGAALLEKVVISTSACNDFTFDTLDADQESEGYWIVQPIRCGATIIRFAFLKVKDKLLLGDIDTE